MKYQATISMTLLFLFLIGLPVSANSQDIQRLSRNSLSRMDVLSRAKLFEIAIQKVAASEGVDPLILWTIAYNETRFRPWLTSPKNAQGMMQFMPGTAARFGLTNPYDPSSSLVAAARYVKVLGGLFDGRLESILAAYNAGEGTVWAYLTGRTLRANGKIINASKGIRIHGVPPYAETIGYVSQGVKIYRWLQERGVFGTNRPTFIAAKAPVQKDIPARDRSSETELTRVFYEPRTGKRSLISTATAQLTLLEVGEIVVGPAIPKSSSQRARTTFAGAVKLPEIKK